MKNEIVITTSDNLVVVCTYYYPVRRPDHELDAIKMAWKEKAEPPVMAPQSVRPTISRVEMYGMKKPKNGVVSISGHILREIQKRLDEVPTAELTPKEVYQSHADFLTGF